ncbi:FRG domain-containing protein [Rhizobium ruizarguesonis]
MSYEYQSYFEPELVFEDDQPLGKGKRNSHEKFCETGFSDSEARDLVASGYDVLLDQVVVDRYYGGGLISYDLRTRFPLMQFRSNFGRQPNVLPVHAVSSTKALFHLIEKLQSGVRDRLIFRGQTAHYAIDRTVPNPTFVNATLGEISLLPSVWRRVLKGRPNVWHQFRDLSMLQWSAIIYHMFDIQSVHEREQAAGLLYGVDHSDDLPDDPALEPIRDFHRHCQAFLREYALGSTPAFLTLLQHYGLYSPVLDLTTDPEVALFFATQKFARNGGACSYTFNGTNQRQAIVYVLREDTRETLKYARSAMLETLDPQRPKRQSCVVMPSNEYSMNLAGDFLVAAIRLDFDMAEPGRLRVGDLFPSEKDDLMLTALKTRTHELIRADLTNFAASV